MLIDNQNEPRSAAESYASATAASNLRMEAHRVGPADAIGAAGMSPYRMGLALMRLQSEWDRAAKPKAPTRTLIQQIADNLVTVPIGQPNAGMVAEPQHGGKTIYRKPQEAAERTALAWHLHELGILFGHLKTLPEVRADLERWIGGPHAALVVADTLGWWLEPRCLTCRGAGKRIVEGTGGRDSGKVCYACRFSHTPGQRPMAHSGIARRLLGYIRACCGEASKEQSTKERRTPVGEHARDMAKKHTQVAKLQRADAEATADEAQDRKAIADKFAKGMERKGLGRKR